MRIGIYGGTFDPVHYGHLLAAETSRETLGLDRVVFVPAAHPPHKLEHKITSGEQRAVMLELAVAGMPEFQVDRRELTRSGPSYTVETLQSFRDAGPANELFLIMGADSLVALPTWHEPQRILELAVIVTVNRGSGSIEIPATCLEIPGASERIRCVSMPGIDLSASDLRDRAHRGQSLRFRTPRAVETYVKEHRLY